MLLTVSRALACLVGVSLSACVVDVADHDPERAAREADSVSSRGDLPGMADGDNRALAAAAAPHHGALVRTGVETRHVAGLDRDGFVATWQRWSDDGYRLIDLDVGTRGDQRFYAGVFEPGRAGHDLLVGASADELVSRDDAMTAQGLRLVDVEVSDEGGRATYAAVWREGSGDARLVVDLDWTAFHDRWDELSRRGLRLIDLAVRVDGDARRYSGVFRSGTDRYALWVDADWNTFAAKTRELRATGLELVDVESYDAGGARLYAGVFREAGRGDGGDVELIAASGDQPLQRKLADRADAGAWPVELFYDGLHDLPPVGLASMFHDKLDGHAIGYSYAVAEQGQVVSAGGFGLARADWEMVDPGVAMTGATRLQIASLSKPLTAVALLTLLDGNPDAGVDTPFLSLLGGRFVNVAPGVERVTLRQLLTHRSGMPVWDYCDKRGPMAELVARPLVAAPGALEQYSNGNFCLVRQVIEAMSGQSYVDYVQQHVLAPMGISGMSCKADPVARALYYPYDARGVLGVTWESDFSDYCAAYGWHASAAQLAQFLAGVRNHTVLSAEMTRAMLDQGLGWWRDGIRSGNAYDHRGYWKTAEGAGYNGALAVLPDDTDAVILINSNGFYGPSNGINLFAPVAVLLDGFNRDH